MKLQFSCSGVVEYSCSRSSGCCSTDHRNFVQCFLFSHIKQFCKTSSIELCFKCLAWRHQTTKSLRCCLRFAYARTSFTYALSSTLRRPYADKFQHVTTVSAYAQQLLHARIEVVIGKIKQWTMKTWKKRKKMMKKYHQQKLAEHEADDVF